MTFAKSLRVERSPRGHVTASALGESVVVEMDAAKATRLQCAVLEWEREMDRLERVALVRLRERLRQLRQKAKP